MRKFFSFLALVAVVVFAGACGDYGTGSEPRKFSTAGRWSGSASGLTIRLTLSESDGAITGSGTANGRSSIPLNVSGSNAANIISLRMTSAGFEPLRFTGNITSARAMEGSLNGSGFNNDALTLAKQ